MKTDSRLGDARGTIGLTVAGSSIVCGGDPVEGLRLHSLGPSGRKSNLDTTELDHVSVFNGGLSPELLAGVRRLIPWWPQLHDESPRLRRLAAFRIFRKGPKAELVDKAQARELAASMSMGSDNLAVERRRRAKFWARIAEALKNPGRAR